jgi:hypothetical protein
MSKNAKIFLTVALAFVISVTVVGILIIMNSNSASKSSTTVQVPTQIAVETTETTPALNLPLQNLSGNWSADSGNGATMTATIQSNEIRITLNNEGAKMLYWVGTFNPLAGSGDTVTSTKIEINKAVLSRAGSKDFVIGKDAISFDLSAMGKTTKVVLTRA